MPLNLNDYAWDFDRDVRIYQGRSLEILAGSIEQGDTDGVGKDARFEGILDAVLDATETNIFLVDARNQKLKRLEIDTLLVSSSLDFSLVGTPLTIGRDPVTDTFYIGLEDGLGAGFVTKWDGVTSPTTFATPLSTVVGLESPGDGFVWYCGLTVPSSQRVYRVPATSTDWVTDSVLIHSRTSSSAFLDMWFASGRLWWQGSGFAFSIPYPAITPIGSAISFFDQGSGVPRVTNVEAHLGTGRIVHGNANDQNRAVRIGIARADATVDPANSLEIDTEYIVTLIGDEPTPSVLLSASTGGTNHVPIVFSDGRLWLASGHNNPGPSKIRGVWRPTEGWQIA